MNSSACKPLTRPTRGNSSFKAKRGQSSSSLRQQQKPTRRPMDRTGALDRTRTLLSTRMLLPPRHPRAQELWMEDPRPRELWMSDPRSPRAQEMVMDPQPEQSAQTNPICWMIRPLTNRNQRSHPRRNREHHQQSHSSPK